MSLAWLFIYFLLWFTNIYVDEYIWINHHLATWSLQTLAANDNALLFVYIEDQMTVHWILACGAVVECALNDHPQFNHVLTTKRNYILKG